MSIDTAEQTTTEPILTVTEGAKARILEIREEDPEAAELALRVRITGVNGVDYVYDLSLEPVDEAEEGEHLHTTDDGLAVMIPADSIDNLRGAVLDLPSNPMQGGLVIRNPNRPNPLAGHTLELTGTLPEKVQQLITQQINPALGAHGGFTTLVGVEGTKVFLTMGGGCQGCSMSAATLVDGIQRAILEAIPEVTEVIDATDHTAGENPFYH